MIGEYVFGLLIVSWKLVFLVGSRVLWVVSVFDCVNNMEFDVLIGLFIVMVLR